MNTPSSNGGDGTVLASRSLLSVSLTATLASITHAHDFGTSALAVGVVVVAMLVALNSRFRRTGSRPALVLYGLLNLWIIVGFGLVGGFWNHAVKVSLVALNGGTLPAGLEPVFMSPGLGSPTYEAVSILTFAASVLTAYLGFRFVRTVGWRTL